MNIIYIFIYNNINENIIPCKKITLFYEYTICIYNNLFYQLIIIRYYNY